MENRETVSNTDVIENADSKTQVLDLIQDMVYAGGNEGSP